MKETAKEAFQKAAKKARLSDKQLEFAIKWSRRLALVSATGVFIWGGLALVGGLAVGLKLAGIGVPAILGVSTLTTGALMTTKALVQRHIFKTVHNKSIEHRQKRIRQGEYTLPHPTTEAEPLGATFNPKAAVTKVAKVIPLPKKKKQPSIAA